MRRGPGNRVCQAGQLAPGERVQFHRVPGGHSEGETPGPIPNPEVKPLSADGTAREASRESRTPPEHTLQKGLTRHGPALFAFPATPPGRPDGKAAGHEAVDFEQGAPAFAAHLTQIA